MTASVFCWRAACAAWGEPARPGLSRRGNGKGEIGFLAPQAGGRPTPDSGQSARQNSRVMGLGLSL